MGVVVTINSTGAQEEYATRVWVVHLESTNVCRLVLWVPRINYPIHYIIYCKLQMYRDAAKLNFTRFR